MKNIKETFVWVRACGLTGWRLTYTLRYFLFILLFEVLVFLFLYFFVVKLQPSNCVERLCIYAVEMELSCSGYSASCVQHNDLKRKFYVYSFSFFVNVNIFVIKNEIISILIWHHSNYSTYQCQLIISNCIVNCVFWKSVAF